MQLNSEGFQQSLGCLQASIIFSEEGKKQRLYHLRKKKKNPDDMLHLVLASSVFKEGFIHFHVTSASPAVVSLLHSTTAGDRQP